MKLLLGVGGRAPVSRSREGFTTRLCGVHHVLGHFIGVIDGEFGSGPSMTSSGALEGVPLSAGM